MLRAVSSFGHRIKSSWTNYLWLMPSFILLLIFAIYPVYELFITSFTRMSLSGRPIGYAGLLNYINLFEVGQGSKVFLNTFLWTVLCVTLTHLLCIFIALILNASFPGRKFVRSVLLIPWACSQVITALTWRWIYNYDYGALNLLLRQLRIIDENVFWLGSITASWASVVIVGVFVSIPFTTFVLLAGLQSIPREVYEAALADGSRAFNTFKSITLPLLKPVITISVVINTMYTFNNFHVIYAITKGGPAGATDIAVTYMHRTAFEMFDIGRAAAMTVLIFVILVLFAISYIRLMSSEEVY